MINLTATDSWLARSSMAIPTFAVSLFLTSRIEHESQIAAAARAFGVDSLRAFEWARKAEDWSPRVLVRLAETTIDNLVQRTQLSHLQHEINAALRSQYVNTPPPANLANESTPDRSNP